MDYIKNKLCTRNSIAKEGGEWSFLHHRPYGIIKGVEINKTKCSFLALLMSDRDSELAEKNTWLYILI